jgi:hypothetical protein
VQGLTVHAKDLRTTWGHVADLCALHLLSLPVVDPYTAKLGVLYLFTQGLLSYIRTTVYRPGADRYEHSCRHTAAPLQLHACIRMGS